MSNQMKLKVISFAFIIVLLTTDLYAWPWNRRRVRRSYSNRTYTSVTFSGTPAEVCQQKANLCASRNRLAHWGGSFAGCTYEGVGCSTTPQGALNNCCYTGQKPLVASAVAQGSNGLYYAVKLFSSGSTSYSGRYTVQRRRLFWRFRVRRNRR